jgi:hypothetical protein
MPKRRRQHVIEVGREGEHDHDFEKVQSNLIRTPPVSK